MKRLLLASAAFLATTVGAHAADLPVKAPYTKAPPLQAVYDWTGFYIGVNAGVGVGRDRTQHFQPGSFNSFYLAPEGAFGGGQIGYNWQTGSILGPLVYGIEADIQGADMSDGGTRNWLTPPPRAWSTGRRHWTPSSPPTCTPTF